jgi:hypothetical protein
VHHRYARKRRGNYPVPLKPFRGPTRCVTGGGAGADDVTFQRRVKAFQKGLALFSWTIGGNVRIDSRFRFRNSGPLRNVVENDSFD